MNRIERPRWFSAGAGAIALAALLAVDLPDRESNGTLAASSDSLIVRQLERIDERLARLELRPATTPAVVEEAQPAIQADVTNAESTIRAQTYQASLAASREIVDRAIEVGSWTHKDAAAFAAASAGLDMPDRLAIHQRLILAINDDRVQTQPIQRPLR